MRLRAFRGRLLHSDLICWLLFSYIYFFYFEWTWNNPKDRNEMFMMMNLKKGGKKVLKRIFLFENKYRKEIDWYRFHLVWLVNRKNPGGGEEEVDSNGRDMLVEQSDDDRESMVSSLSVSFIYSLQPSRYVLSFLVESTYKTSWLFSNRCRGGWVGVI